MENALEIELLTRSLSFIIGKLTKNQTFYESLYSKIKRRYHIIKKTLERKIASKIRR